MTNNFNPYFCNNATPSSRVTQSTKGTELVTGMRIISFWFDVYLYFGRTLIFVRVQRAEW